MVQSGSVKNPHWVLTLWLMCRDAQGEGSTRPLPEVGGVLDQDAFTMWGFRIIDDAYRLEMSLIQDAEQNKTKREQLRQSLLG